MKGYQMPSRCYLDWPPGQLAKILIKQKQECGTSPQKGAAHFAYLYIPSSNSSIFHSIKWAAVHAAVVYGQKLYGSVAVPSAPFRVPTQWPVARMSRQSVQDNENAVKPWIMYTPDICLTAKGYPENIS